MTESFSFVNDAGMVVFSPRADFRKKNNKKTTTTKKNKSQSDMGIFSHFIFTFKSPKQTLKKLFTLVFALRLRSSTISHLTLSVSFGVIFFH